MDGHLKAADVEELTKASRLADDIHVLDLSDLQSADSADLPTLRELASMGARLCNATPYLELLLKSKA